MRFILLVVFLALTRVATAQNASPSPSDPQSQYKSSQRFTAIGVANGDKCQIQFKGRMKKGTRAIGGTSVSGPRFHDGLCEVDFIIGEPTEAALADEQQRMQHDTPAPAAAVHDYNALRKKVTTVTPAVPELWGWSSAHSRQWVTDPVFITVNSTTANLTWNYDGSEVHYPTGGFAKDYLSITGWYVTYEWGFTDNSTGMARASYHVSFENDVFCVLCCGGLFTWIDHNPTEVDGYADGTYGWEVWLTMGGGCTSLLTYHWIAACDSGFCF